MSQNQKKKISTFALVMMICVTVAGGGFGIEDLVGSVGPGMTFFVFLVLPFVWSLPFGLSSAELSSAYPEDGGMYTWAKNGLGEKAGFVSGWCYTIAGFVEPATFAVLSANYMKMLIPIEVNDFVYWALCAALIVIFAIINIIGIKLVSDMATVITLLCIIPFIVLIVLSFADINYSPIEPMVPEDMGFLEAAGKGLLVGIWFNTGFETISTMSGDIEDGSRKVPKAIVIAVPLISVMYLLWVVPALASVGHWEDWSSEGPLSFVEIGEIVGGAPLRWAFVVAGSLASMMILCEYILAYAYVMKSFSEKGQFFKIFSKEHKKFKTPYMAITILSCVSILLCSSGSFIAFVGIASILYAVPVIMMFVANIKLRVQNPDLKLDFKVPLPDKVYIAYLCFPIVIYGASVFTDNWIVGLGLAATSIPAYLFFKKGYRGGRYWEECHKNEEGYRSA